MSKYYDAIHGFIELDDVEKRFVKSLPFKRLAFIHQIPSASYVYSGGDHRRFDHSLGVMHVVTKIFDTALIHEPFHKYFPEFTEQDRIYWRRVLRIAALAHDIGHLPFSHVAEEDLIGPKGHEKWTLKILKSSLLAPFFDSSGLSVSDVCKIAVGEEIFGAEYTPLERAFSQMLTGDYFGGDRIDYLLRDAYFTGLAYGSFDYHQLINNLRFLKIGGEVRLGIEEDGLESCYSLLLARYFMHRRLYQHPNVKAYAYHMKEACKNYYEGRHYLDSVENYVSINDYDVFHDINIAFYNPEHPSHVHAKALWEQGGRIAVVPLSLEGYEQLKNSPQAKEENIFFEAHSMTRGNMGLFFPVLLKNGVVVEAQKISDVIIPVREECWAYMSKDFHEKIQKKLIAFELPSSK